MEYTGSSTSRTKSSSASYSNGLNGHINEGLTEVGPNDQRSTDDVFTISNDQDGKQCVQNSVPGPKGWGARHTLMLLGFSGLCAAYMNRVNLSITIVAMVADNSSLIQKNGTEVCPISDTASDTSETSMIEGEFYWDEQTQGVLLSCFFYGYMVSNFFGGLATEYYGGRLVMTFSIFLSSVISLVSPICAKTSIGLFIASRALAGLAQGPCYPAMHSLLATWNPPQDRARFSSVVLAGANVGTVLTMSLGGLMSGSNFLGGWPAVFYVFGVLGVLWCIPWFLLVRDSPQKHPTISAAELHYIEANKSTVKSAERMRVPWTKILTSIPFWTLIILAWGDNFGFFTLLTVIPTYLKNIQHFGMTSNGLLSALPYIIASIFSVVWGAFADFLIAKTQMSVTAVRKISSGIGLYVPGISLVAMCFVGCNSTLAILFLCLAVGANAASNSGGTLSEQDIAPNLAGVLKGITNTIGSLTGIVTPLITGAITSNNQTLTAWRNVFIISAATYCVAGTVFLIFGTNKVQSWNYPVKKRDTNRY